MTQTTENKPFGVEWLKNYSNNNKGHHLYNSKNIKLGFDELLEKAEKQTFGIEWLRSNNCKNYNSNLGKKLYNHAKKLE